MSSAGDDSSESTLVRRIDVGGTDNLPNQPAFWSEDSNEESGINYFWVGGKKKYKKLELVGEGGMGRVWRVEHLRMGRRSALKIMRFDKDVRRFEKEAIFLSQLEHPNIVKVYDSEIVNESVDDTAGDIYIEMELLNGSLKELLAERGEVKVQEAIKILKQVLEALRYIHGEDIIHRDIKPSNVMFVNKDELKIKLIDFGIAKDLKEESMTRTVKGKAMGTQNWMAPEQWNNHPEKRSDIYSCGLLLSAMLGAPPEIPNTPPNLESKSLPESLLKIYKKATQGECGDRYQSADEMLDVLSLIDQKSEVKDKEPLNRSLMLVVGWMMLVVGWAWWEWQQGEEVIEWVKIPAGSFKMGSNDGDSDEKPVHKVTLKSFFISKTEVTVGQYRACVEAKECSSSAVSSCGSPNWTDQVGSKEDHPINCIDWLQAREFAKWAGGDLCSESEWEYSARAGEDFKYSGSNDPDEVGWYYKNSGKSTHPVGKKKKNAWGLYDMSGNVLEWTLDEYKDSYSGAPANGLPVCLTPTCRQKSSRRVIRGGSWFGDARYLRVADRAVPAPGFRGLSLGARLCRTFP